MIKLSLKQTVNFPRILDNRFQVIKDHRTIKYYLYSEKLIKFTNKFKLYNVIPKNIYKIKLNICCN